jgi:hypothetical protein
MRFKVLVLLAGFVFILAIPSFSQGDVPYYVLDGYGGIHSGDGAPAISPKTPYFGWDIARAFEYVAVGTSSTNYGDGILVLDGYGGVHTGGKLSTVSVTKTPYFGWDIARDIVYRNIPPRAYYSSLSVGNTSITSSTFVSILSFYLYLPDDGYVFISGSLCMGNNSITETCTARVALGVDSTTTALDNIEAEQGLPTFQYNSVTRTQMTFLTAGRHYFYLLVKKQTGTPNPQYFDPTLCAIYIDQSWSGISGDVSASGPELTGTGTIK